jgi:hypothetical protein
MLASLLNRLHIFWQWLLERWHGACNKISRIWRRKDFIKEMTKIAALMGAILTVIATLITAIFGAGGIFVVPAINNWLYPKFIPVSATVLLDPGHSYVYCVHLQKEQNYNIMLSSDTDPLDFKIFATPEYVEKNSALTDLLVEYDGVYSFSGPFKPSEDGYYILLIQRAGGEAYRSISSSNQSLKFNVSVETYEVCPYNLTQAYITKS